MFNRIIKFEVQPEHIGGFKAVFNEAKSKSEDEDGYVEANLFVDNKNPEIYFAYERFKDQAAVDLHSEQGYTKKLMTFMADSQIKTELYNLGETDPTPDHDSKSPNAEDDVFIIFFIFKIKDGYRERLLEQFKTHIQHTRTEDGNIIFDLFTIDDMPDTLAVYEHWRKESDVWDVHFKTPYAEVTGALMTEAVVGDMNQYMNFVTAVGS